MRISDWSSDVCSSDLLGKAGLVLVADAGTRRLDHDRLRIAEQRGYDDRLGDVIDLAVLLDDLLQAAGERRDDAIGEQHAKEGADQRRSDHAAKVGRASCRARGCPYV